MQSLSAGFPPGALADAMKSMKSSQDLGEGGLGGSGSGPGGYTYNGGYNDLSPPK